MMVGAFYKQLGYLAIGTSVSGLAWLSCRFFPLPAFLWLYFTVVLCMSKLRLEREGILSSSDVLNFIVILESELAVKTVRPLLWI